MPAYLPTEYLFKGMNGAPSLNMVSSTLKYIHDWKREPSSAVLAVASFPHSSVCVNANQPKVASFLR